MINIDEAVTAQRQEMYQFLAGLFLQPPSTAMLELLKEKGASSLLPTGEDTAIWMQEMNAFCEEIKTMIDPAGEMEAEYTALFVLPSGVLPHEAVYVDEKKRLGGRVTMAVALFYEEAALKMSEGCIEMPDHLGIELEFMARLCGLERSFRMENDQISLQICCAFQHNFMNRHLGCWARQCCEEVMSLADYGFYRAVAQITLAFLAAEEEYLSCEETVKENLVWESATA